MKKKVHDDDDLGVEEEEQAADEGAEDVASVRRLEFTDTEGEQGTDAEFVSANDMYHRQDAIASIASTLQGVHSLLASQQPKSHVSLCIHRFFLAKMLFRSSRR